MLKNHFFSIRKAFIANNLQRAKANQYSRTITKRIERSIFGVINMINHRDVSFETAILQGVLVFDGPMGTELYRHHIFTNRCYDELNLSDPGLIKSVHQDYCDAGADVLTTNTYGANRIALEKHGLSDQVARINAAGVQMAREVASEAGRDVYIAGSVGPIISAVNSEIKLIEIIVEQVSALVSAGIDVIIFETQPSRAALEFCTRAMQQVPEMPYILSCAVVHGCESVSGETV